MADYTPEELNNVVTSSDDLSAGSTSTLTFTTEAVNSYFTLETTRNSSGKYDSNSPTNLSGSIENLVNIVTAVTSSDYIHGFVLGEGTSSFDFTPANDVSGSTLELHAAGSIYLSFGGGGGGGCTPVLSLELQIGSGTSSSSNVPFYGLYDYSWFGGIWLQSELGDTKQMTGIEFEVTSYTTPYTYNNLEIWVHHVVEDIFDSSPLVNLSDLTISDTLKVATTNLTISSNGWQTITFDENFCYNGTSNIVLEFRNYDGTWQSGFGRGKYDFSPSISRAAHKATDGQFPTGAATRSNSRVNMRFKY